MKHAVLWQQLLCASVLFAYVLSTVRAHGDDDLDNFDFVDLDSDLKGERKQQLTRDQTGVIQGTAVDESESAQNNFIPLDEDWEDGLNGEDSSPEQDYLFSYREKMMRTVLAKALSNVKLRQRFVEIMPILRALSSQQRLALSALITAQMTTRRVNPFNLEEVRSIFGNDKTLLLPIMFDIANLVRSSAIEYLPAENTSMSGKEDAYSLDRRELEITSEEEAEEEDMIGVLQGMSEEVLDPQSINEKLLEPMPEIQRLRRSLHNIFQRKLNKRRTKRSVEGEELIHKLVRAVPLSTHTEEELQRGYEKSRMLKINTTVFETPKDSFSRPEYATQSSISDYNYQQVEDLAFLNLNGTYIKEIDIEETTTITPNKEEVLPTPEGLISGPRYRVNPNKLRPIRQKAVATRKRVQIQARPKAGASASPQLPLPKKCERFTSSMCIRTDDYPL